MARPLSNLGLLLLLIVSGLIGLGAACNGTHRPPHVAPEHADAGAAALHEPTLRIYYLVDLDGYLEPCGCQARPLGGIDRLAGFMQNQRANAPTSILVATGNLLYRDVTMDPRMDFQETTKAESIVRILDQLGLVAFAPGPSDYVRGAEVFARDVSVGHAVALAANVQGAPYQPGIVREFNGTQVGIVGVSDFHDQPDSNPPAGAPATSDPVDATRAAVQDLRRRGATVVIVLASVPRRVARTIAGDVQGVNFVIAAREESNTAPPPEQIGSAYLVTAANQGKNVGILDLYIRNGTATLQNASQASVDADRARLDARIHDLSARIASWTADPTVDRAAVAQQRTRLAAMERERAALNGPQAPPPSGNYFDARVQEVAPGMQRRRDVRQTISDYFRTVNQHNHDAYADLHPPRPRPGDASYVGMEECRDCHAEAFDIWVRTPHARAYHTLEVINKNYNLSCVSCHVTGYDRPGGAEVVLNDGRRDVQCESCHGPGSLHIAAHTPAQRRATIQRQVPAAFCAGNCHTPEHSDQFDYQRYLPRILGPGHGYPTDGHGGAVTLTMPVLVGTATPPRDEEQAPDASVAADGATTRTDAATDVPRQ